MQIIESSSFFFDCFPHNEADISTGVASQDDTLCQAGSYRSLRSPVLVARWRLHIPELEGLESGLPDNAPVAHPPAECDECYERWSWENICPADALAAAVQRIYG